MDSRKKAIVRLKKALDIFFKKDNDVSSTGTFKTEDSEYLKSVVSKQELYNTINTEKAWTQFEQKIKTSKNTTPKPTTSIWQSTLKYAAIAIGISFGLFFFIQNQTEENKHQLTTKQQEKTIQLNILGESTKYIKTSGNTEITNANGEIIAFQNGKEINYNTIDHNSQKEQLIQEIKVPYGQTLRIILSDGTKVYCDAGTKLQFPTKFPKTGERKVSLSGQAFFDVVSDVKNPFIVNTNSMDVRVLGTQFNVSAYDNNSTTQTVLVEGLVKIKLKHTLANTTKLISLVPGQMATYNEHSKRALVKTVNTYNHTAWISQKLIFKETPFISILKTLERRFNVTIINKNKALDHEIFTAKFTDETLDQILNAFKTDNDLSYTIKNDQVLIK
ncbi:hypothetical protein A8C32_19040 [Flavivirga aquatica]|uniref:Iron dicitrate transport regulator FecR n=1 Tax=Flavivirga aquatica TaxID=1849968 RepID=A0A1E5T420_9FLAO|nr:FecR family protein [Flavivirga aquatica]OEK06128.1 hypothetical protein A8C32_19040 [Flavivirga aquatica]